MKSENNQSQLDHLAGIIRNFSDLINRGVLDLSSEATARSWIEDLLKFFGWDPLNPQEVDQEIYLSKNAQQNLEEIASSHKKPDYLLCNGTRQYIYIDAKKIDESIGDNKKIAFQIRSYGWSAGHPCAIVTNFKEIAIYDCRFKPHHDDDPAVARVHFLNFLEYVDNFEILSQHLKKSRILDSELNDLYSDYEPPRGSKPLDKDFSEHIRMWRLRLANSILSRNRGVSIEQISYVTQVLIDRTIFLRVAEGLKIEGNKRLLELTKIINGNNWEGLKRFFSDYCHAKYAGALFSEQKILDDIDINFDEVRGFIETLYYPHPYQFDVITPNLLGNIYERYLGRKLVKRGNKISDEFKEEYQKTKGAVYTPTFIVQQICKKTLEPLLKKRKLSDILELKIADPACGSGSFLLGVYDYLISAITNKYSQENKQNAKRFSAWFWLHPRNGRLYTKTNAKKLILNSCVFGLDIDPQATEISRLSLSLKMLENLNLEPEMFMELGLLERKLLDGIGKNIRLGNAIIGSKILDSYPGLRNDLEQLKKLKPFDWQSDSVFGPIFNKGGFHAIVGNPPYIEVKHYKKDLPVMHKYLSNPSQDREYKSCGTGKTDISMPFIEKGLSLLRNDGRLGFIIQNRFFKTQYGANSREMLGKAKVIEEIMDFGSIRIFPERTTYTCILILNKAGDKSSFNYLKIEKQQKLEAQLLEPLKHGIATFVLENQLSSAPWFFGPPELLKLRDILAKRCGTIAKHNEALSISVGLQVLYKKIYYIKGKRQGKYVVGKNLLGADVKIESAITRPLVVNREFYSFKKILANDFVVFPYQILTEKKKQIISYKATGLSLNKIKEKFPKAYKYLINNKKTIQKEVETRPGNSWHLYTRDQNLVSQSFNKVLVPSTLRDLIATVDIDSGFYQDNVRINSIQLREPTPAIYRAICAVINSKIFDCLAKITAEKLANGYYQMNRQFLEPVPLPLKQILIQKSLVEQLSQLYLQLSAACKKYVVADNEEDRDAARVAIRALQTELDTVVECEVYQLNDAERKTIFEYAKRQWFDQNIDFVRGESMDDDVNGDESDEL